MRLLLTFNSLLFLCALAISNVQGAEIKRLHGIITIGDKVAKVGTIVNEGDVVDASGKSSFVDIVFKNGDVIRISGKTVLKKFRPEKQTFFEILKGKIFIYAKPNLKRKLNVKTQTAVFAVRGTKFLISSEEKGDYLCVCEGLVKARLLKDKSKVANVRKGYDLHTYQDQPLSKAVEASEVMLKMTIGAFSDMGLPVE